MPQRALFRPPLLFLSDRKDWVGRRWPFLPCEKKEGRGASDPPSRRRRGNDSSSLLPVRFPLEDSDRRVSFFSLVLLDIRRPRSTTISFPFTASLYRCRRSSTLFSFQKLDVMDRKLPPLALLYCAYRTQEAGRVEGQTSFPSLPPSAYSCDPGRSPSPPGVS